MHNECGFLGLFFSVLIFCRDRLNCEHLKLTSLHCERDEVGLFHLHPYGLSYVNLRNIFVLSQLVIINTKAHSHLSYQLRQGNCRLV